MAGRMHHSVTGRVVLYVGTIKQPRWELESKGDGNKAGSCVEEPLSAHNVQD